jgi:hypothetical protein
VHGQVFIVGGTAMALAYSTRRVTKDIDAVFEPKAVIYDSARRVAARLRLPENWLNDGVKRFLPGADNDARPLPEIAGIEVTTASPRYLLAMKLLAMRFGEDDDDIQILLRQVGITSADEGLALLAQMYPRRKALPKTRLFLEEILSSDERGAVPVGSLVAREILTTRVDP